MDEIQKAAGVLISKYHATHHEVADAVDFSLAQALTLYGLLRLSEMAIGSDQSGPVDKKIATMMLTGPDQPLEWPHACMGALAGAYRFYQGGYKTGQAGQSPFNRLADQLCEVFAGIPAHKINTGSLLTVCPTLSMAGVVLRRPELFDAAIDLFETVSKELQHSSSGVYSHTLNSGRGWCRANGEAAAALVEILRYLPYRHPRRAGLVARLKALLTTLLALQTPRGLWRQILSEPDTVEETSGSALIAYALFSACAMSECAVPGWAAAAEAAWGGLMGQVNLKGNGNINGVCADPPPGADQAEYRSLPAALNHLYGFGSLLIATAAYAWLKRQATWKDLPGPRYHFAPPPVQDVERYLAGVHATCEQNRNADGSYYNGTINDPDITFDEIIKESRTEHPIPRDTAHCVLGYLDLYRHSPDPVYLDRARAGLDWLVKEQEPDGCYRLWTRKKEGQVPHHGCLFETGIAGAALIKGYEVFGDERYLAASDRAARWAMRWPVDRNVNFNAFVIWHMAEHYRLAGGEELLDSATYKTRQAMIAPQQAGGGWLGHNSWIWYHGINIRAYASLYQVLPAEHPFKPELEAALRASLAYFFRLQMENGAVHPNPEHSDKPSHLMFEIIVGLVRAVECLPDPAIRESLDGLVAFRITAESGDPDKLFNNEKGYWLLGCSPWYVYALGAYLGMK